jgi:hypothetical protein
MKTKLQLVAHQPSWVVRSDVVEMAISQVGGQMAPVRFFPASRRPIQPYWVNPWADEKPKLPWEAGCLGPCRGDWFCMPFGANAENVQGEHHPVHGEPAMRKWTFGGLETRDRITTLTLSMNTRIREGRIVKNLYLRDAHAAVYSTHTLSGYRGAMPIGHHHTLRMPEDHPESVLVAGGAIRFGMTNPARHSDPAVGEYQLLDIGKKFSDLTRVPTLFKNPRTVDCSAFPTRRGFVDLLQIFQKPEDTPAWLTATFTSEGFLWYSLRDARVLPATLFWIENHGRHSAPWAGRNCCLGLENTCSFFADGLAASTRKNVLNRAGIPTAVKLNPTRPTDIRMIQGVVRTPRGFGRVSGARFEKNKVVFLAGRKQAAARVRWEFLADGAL